jgi:hypothetical protein
MYNLYTPNMYLLKLHEGSQATMICMYIRGVMCLLSYVVDDNISHIGTRRMIVELTSQ